MTTARRVGIGMPSCRKAIPTRPTSVPLWFSTSSRPSVPNVPITVASTSSPPASASSASTRSGGTDSTIRSCASLIQISSYRNPAYFSGTAPSSTVAPTRSPISPTADDSPPAPQSVTPVNSPASRACRITSATFFSVIALPICTAWLNSSACVSVSSALLNVAPWMPSRPVRPPSTRIRSPYPTAFSILSRGITPTHPQNTSGLPMYRSSK